MPEYPDEIYLASFPGRIEASRTKGGEFKQRYVKAEDEPPAKPKEGK